MKEITCPRCGQSMSEGYTQCPLCGTAIEEQPPSTYNAAQKRYIVWFVLLSIFCLVVALWLPR